MLAGSSAWKREKSNRSPAFELCRCTCRLLLVCFNLEFKLLHGKYINWHTACTELIQNKTTTSTYHYIKIQINLTINELYCTSMIWRLQYKYITHIFQKENHKYVKRLDGKLHAGKGVLLHLFLRLCQLGSNLNICDTVWMSISFLATVRLCLFGIFQFFPMFAKK